MSHPFPLRILFTTAVLSVTISEALLAFMQHPELQADMLAGIVVGLAAHALSLFAFQKAIGRDASTFMLFGLGSIILRLFSLIIFILAVIVSGFLQAAPVLVGVLASYFIGSWSEIAWLNKQNAVNADKSL